MQDQIRIVSHGLVAPQTPQALFQVWAGRNRSCRATPHTE